MVRSTSILVAIILMVVSFDIVSAQEKMSKDEWQTQVQENTAKRNELKARLDKSNSDIASVKSKISDAEAALKKCKDELYALVGASAADIAAFEGKLKDLEQRVNEMARMSDEDLMMHRGDLDQILSMLNDMAKSKIAQLPEFYDRINSLRDKIAALQMAIAGKQKMYSVGTWQRDRDCLWNIARKKDIYDNAWWWPKIWQGNRDQIKDPDLIYPGQKLKIPSAGPLTPDEKKAANSYYQKKASMGPTSSK